MEEISMKLQHRRKGSVMPTSSMFTITKFSNLNSAFAVRTTETTGPLLSCSLLWMKLLIVNILFYLTIGLVYGATIDWSVISETSAVSICTEYASAGTLVNDTFYFPSASASTSWKYNLRTNEWSQLPIIPDTNLFCPVCASFPQGRFIYCFGDGWSYQYSYRYDIALGTWSPIAAVPFQFNTRYSAISYGTIEFTDDSSSGILISGGLLLYSCTNNQPQTVTFEYYPQFNNYSVSAKFSAGESIQTYYYNMYYDVESATLSFMGGYDLQCNAATWSDNCQWYDSVYEFWISGYSFPITDADYILGSYYYSDAFANVGIFIPYGISDYTIVYLSHGECSYYPIDSNGLPRSTHGLAAFGTEEYGMFYVGYTNQIVVFHATLPLIY